MKRKDEYYSLIFIKILKFRGFLKFKNKTKTTNNKTRPPVGVTKNSTSAFPDGRVGQGLGKRITNFSGRNVTLNSVHKGGTATHSKQKVLQGKNNISLPKKGRVKLAATEMEKNKIPLITFYPGGRYIND